MRGEGARAASYAATLAAFLMAAIIGSVLRRTSGRSATPLLAAVVLLTFAAALGVSEAGRTYLLLLSGSWHDLVRWLSRHT